MDREWLHLILGFIGGIVPVLLAWVIQLMIAKAKMKRDDRADTTQEWRGLMEQQKTSLKDAERRATLEIARIRRESERAQAKWETELEKVSDRLYNTIEAEKRCNDRVARLEATNKLYAHDLRRLQLLVHDPELPVTVPCVLSVSVEDGVIRVATASSGPLLGWQPNDLIGKPLKLIVPPDLWESHEVALKKALDDTVALDPNKMIHTYALKRGQNNQVERVPITITSLTKWRSPKGSLFVNAEIRPRIHPDADLAAASTAPMAEEEHEQ